MSTFVGCGRIDADGSAGTYYDRAPLWDAVVQTGVRPMRLLLRQNPVASAQMMRLGDAIDRCVDAFHPGLELQRQKLRIVARLVQVAAVEP